MDIFCRDFTKATIQKKKNIVKEAFGKAFGGKKNEEDLTDNDLEDGILSDSCEALDHRNNILDKDKPSTRQTSKTTFGNNQKKNEFLKAKEFKNRKKKDKTGI